AAVETAREQVAALVGAAPAEVVFTSGGTEADNLAVKGAVLARPPGDRHLVGSAGEDHAALRAARRRPGGPARGGRPGRAAGAAAAGRDSPGRGHGGKKGGRHRPGGRGRGRA